MAKDDYRLVYTSDGSHKHICKVCQKQPCICQKKVAIDPQSTTIKMRLEKNGRGGKIVTVLFELPYNPEYFSQMCKHLKNLCGTGGTYKNERIEIQGDHKTKISAHLQKLGFKVKQAGA